MQKAQNITMDNLKSFVGQTLAVSQWLEVDQERVNNFGNTTNHIHWGHLDPERSKAELPFGGTLVQGLLVASLLPYFIEETEVRPPDAAYGLNYGFDRVRFLEPIVIGDGVSLRDRIKLLQVDESRGPDRLLVKTSHTIETENSKNPVAYLEWLILYVRQAKSEKWNTATPNELET